MPKGVYIRNPEMLVRRKLTLKRGWKHSPETIRNMRLTRKEENNACWKGNKAGYDAIHRWLKRHFGKANKCENTNCKTKSPLKFEWANLSGKYKRDRNDFKMLCVPCHTKMDYGNYCHKGHPLFGDNCRINKTGHRICRTCMREYMRKRRLCKKLNQK